MKQAVQRSGVGKANQPFDKIVFAILMAAIALVAVLALWRGTRFGLGLVNDSAAYVNGAENIALGNGYVRTSGGGELKPLTHFPVLFSLVLAGIGFMGIGYTQAAHGLILALFGLDSVLVAALVLKIGRSRFFALLAALAFALSEMILGVYAFLLSEPLFITLLLIAMIVFFQFLIKQTRLWLVLFGAVLGLMYLTRFVGLSFFGVTILFLVGFSVGWKEIIRRCLAISAGFFPFLLGWMVYAYSQTGNIGNRQMVIHLVPFTKWFEALKNLVSWAALDLLTEAHPLFGWALSAISLLLLPVLVLWVGWRFLQFRTSRRTLDAESLLAVYIALTIPGYFLFLIFSMSVFDASTPFDTRILSLLYVPQIILFFCGTAYIFSVLQPSSKAVRFVVAAGCIVFVIFNGYDGIRTVEQYGRDGLGFNHRGWRESPAIAYIRSAPEAAFYSNRPTAIYLLTGKTSYIIPTEVDPVTQQYRPDYETDLEEMKAQIRSGEAILVFFEMSGDESDPPSELTIGLNLAADYGDAQIFSAP